MTTLLTPLPSLFASLRELDAPYPPALLAERRAAFRRDIELRNIAAAFPLVTDAEELNELAMRAAEILCDPDFIEPCDVTEEQYARNSRPFPY